MILKRIFIISCACLMIAGCTTTRSISNSSYHSRYQQTRELSEFDVLGISPSSKASDREIVAALERSQSIRLKPGSSILLIQSGAAFPDKGMVEELSKNYRVVPFSGSITTNETQSLSRALRLAAAQSGAETMICYWGILESGSEAMATKTISWVPVVDWFVPDERQHMRIRVKLAVVDVRTGDWTMVSPDAIESSAYSTNPRRAAVDQKMVEKLKGEAYASAAKHVVQRFGN